MKIVLVLSLLVSAAYAATVTPMGKVIDMLKEMELQGEKEKKAEAVQFAAYQQFCEKTEVEKKRIIADSKDKVEVLTAEIEKSGSDAEKLAEEIAGHLAEVESVTAEKEAASKVRETERKDFQAMLKDYTESVDAIGRALKVLKAQAAPALVQLKSLELPEHASRGLNALLSEGSEEQLGEPSYEFQSGGVVAMLEKLEDKFVEERLQLEKDETSKKNAFDLLAATLTRKIEQEKKSEKKSKDNLGGGETTTTQYSYSKKWSKFQIDSAHFKQSGHRNNICIPGLKAGEQSLANETVRYGESYYMPTDLVNQLSQWTDAFDLIKAPVKFDSYTFEKSSGQWFYHPMRNAPEVGDVRVCFEYVPEGPVSIMALQCGDKIRGNAAASFMPYRLVNRGWCGTLSGEPLKEALLAQGQKTATELYEEDACRTGPFFYLCCCCNLITMIFARASPPQIFAAWHGHLSREQCLHELNVMGMVLKWGLRIVSWLLLYAAVYMLFEPLIVVLDIIPFLGKYISSGTSWVLGVTILFITAVLATVVISVAYLIYHPLIALVCMAGVGLILGAALGISRLL